MSIGQNVRRIREEQRYTQAEIARRCGVTRAAIWSVEHGDSNPSAPLLVKLARALDVTLEELVEERAVSVPLAEASPEAGQPSETPRPGWAATSDIGAFSERVSRLSVEELRDIAVKLSAERITAREDLPLERSEALGRVTNLARILVVHDEFLMRGVAPPRGFTLAHRRHLDVLASDTRDSEATKDEADSEAGTAGAG